VDLWAIVTTAHRPRSIQGLRGRVNKINECFRIGHMGWVVIAMCILASRPSTTLQPREGMIDRREENK